MSQVRPALTVDVNVGGQGGRNVAGKAAAQARASAQGPASQQQQQSSGGMTVRPGDVISEEDLMAQGGFSSDEDAQDAYATGSSKMKMSSGVRGAQATRSSNSEYQGQDGQVSRLFARCQVRTEVLTTPFLQYLGDSDSSEGEDYGQQEGDVDMGSEEEEGMYDEDEDDEMSSSPSIPDENIDFDLVYALHNFIATVEGQATVNKGNSLTLLDDSNSYW